MTEWRRLHPLTPLLRGGRVLVGVLVVVVQQGLAQSSVLASLVVLGLAVPVALVYGLVSWRVTRYRLEGDELQVDSGVLQRRQRRVPLRRLQSVDVVRPLLARVLGLAELRLEVAGGGGDAEAPLAFLSEADAQRLRRQMLARSGALEDAQEEADQDEQLLVQVPSRALVVSILLSGPTVAAGVLLALLLVALVVEPAVAAGALPLAGPLLLGLGSFAVRRLLTEYGFTVAESPDGLRLRHGLLETRAQTIPLGRVQTVRVEQPLLWRRRGWVRVEVDVAGYTGRGDEQQLTSALLPVAPRGFAGQLVERVLGAALPAPTATAPRAARWLAPVEQPVLRLGVDDRHVVGTSGRLTRHTDIVPLAKVQSLRRTQGPLQRRLGLASVHVDSAGRRLAGLTAQHRDAAEADALVDDLALRARAARTR